MSEFEQDRLRLVDSFDTNVVERIREVADNLRNTTWPEIAAPLEVITFTPRHGHPIQVLDMIPKGGYDGVLMLHSAMAIPMDETAIMRAVAVFEAAVNKRVIVVGNPGPPGQNSGTIPFRDLGRVARGDFRPAIGPAFEYLASQGIDSAIHGGISYGADLTAASGQHADKFDQEVSRMLLTDPASVKKRGMLGLSLAFVRTGTKMDELYVGATRIPAYFEARAASTKSGGGTLGYGLGLLRPSNLAPAWALSQDGFEGRVDAALAAHPHMTTQLTWGSYSELANHGLMLEVASRLTDTYGTDRFRTLILEKQRHAMGSDILLHAGIILQGLQSP